MQKYKYQTLLKEMKKNKDSQEEIGELIGLSSLSVRKKLAGITDWTISEIRILCKYYKMDFKKLFKVEE